MTVLWLVGTVHVPMSLFGRGPLCRRKIWVSLKSDRSICEIRKDLDVRGLVVRSYDPLAAFGCLLFLL